MIDGKKILAIIPARGGSKGLVGKNILPLGGLPLIVWSINAAKNSKYIDRIILSSDDMSIHTVAREYGCDVPFIRPAELATDTADSISVIAHAVDMVGEAYDIIILLQPTSPFRNEKHIDAAIELYAKNTVSTLVSVTELDKSPEWIYWLDAEDNTLSPLYSSEKVVSRRQDSRKAYVLNGAIYVFDKGYFVNFKKLINPFTLAYVMDKDSSIDIDSKEDLIFAQIKVGELL